MLLGEQVHVTAPSSAEAGLSSEQLGDDRAAEESRAAALRTPLALVQGVAVPFLTAQLARRGGGSMSDYADRLAVSSEGSVFSLALSLGEQDLEALGPQGGQSSPSSM